MRFLFELVGWFFLWTLYSYLIHRLAHVPGRYNFLRYCHLKHHGYSYGDSMWPPIADYFFWFGSWRGSLDVYITFTLPLVVLAIVKPEYGLILLAFHYIYEVFFSKNVLDHNPKITGKITRFIPIGQYHLKHHRNYRCNYSFYLTIWDYLFRTNEEAASARRVRKLAPKV